MQYFRTTSCSHAILQVDALQNTNSWVGALLGISVLLPTKLHATC